MTPTDKRTPAASPARGGFSPRGGRGGSFSGGRGRGSGHGSGRGGSGHQNFTNGHQASRGKQNYDSGKPTTTVTTSTTNGDARKDTNAAAPASVEGTADGLGEPTTVVPTETTGTTDDTVPKPFDPPKGAAAPPAARKMPGTTRMSWAQIARWVLLHLGYSHYGIQSLNSP